MNRDDFVRHNQPTWDQVEDLLDRLDEGRRVEHELAEFPALYRRCCHHLALARQRDYDAEVEGRLHQIALRGYRHLYRRRSGGLRKVLRFLGADFPRLVRRHARTFWLATVLFYGPALAMGWMVLEQPDAVYSLLELEQVAQFEEMYRDPPQDERDASIDFGMFGFYIYNNVGIALRTFAAGILLAIGTIVILTFNGLYLGAVFAHLTNEGIADHLLTFVITHGAFELTAIVLAGVGGLRLGAAVVSPGRRRRVDALRSAAPEALSIALGSAFLLLLAAFLEAFWSSASWASPDTKVAVGSAAWIAVYAYLGLGGRRGS
ncbi:MAG: stage II sporulation protein M [Thermoanaerobaculia bacterium]|nr:stage II sporulation protein M [Thermoanaerobaculia bacterium]